MKQSFVAMGLALFLAAVQANGQGLDGAAIIAKVDSLMNPETSQARMEMVVEGRGGETRTFVYDSWSLGRGEKNLVRYVEPRRLLGQATLMLNHADDIWMYFPRTQRVRKLASHAKRQKMEGSDFSYEDMGSGDAFVTDYAPKRLDDQRLDKADCLVVQLDRQDGGDAAYGRILMWVDAGTFVPLRLDYFDENRLDEPAKRLTQDDIQVIDGVPTAMHMVMENLIDGTRTTLRLSEVRYNLPLDAALFTERGMSR